MKKIIILTIVSMLLLSCGPTPNTEVTETIVPFTETNLPSTKTPIPLTSTIPTETKIPTATNTPAPVIDSNGNITWHPQQVLIQVKSSGGDGISFDYPPSFLLLWDGTLFQEGNSRLDAPFISHLNQEEVCKILNTVDVSGFFSEVQDYQFPFDGLGRETIEINAWQSNTSGGQLLSYAISGATYYDGLFCRDCPIPSPETIIKPSLANPYFFLDNYYSSTRQKAPIEKLLIYLLPTDSEATHSWPLKSITSQDFYNKCEENNCFDAGMVIDGELAREISDKIRGQVFAFENSFGATFSFSISYRVAWPYEASNFPKVIPPDYTLTCNPNMGTYPILPLNSENQFWYYLADGKWGAEVVNGTNQFEQIRIVNTSGYEKYYEYDPALFSQNDLQIYPRYWTEDGKYFYVNILQSGYDFRKTPFVNSLGLQRISIEDGKVAYVFIGTQGKGFAYNLSEEHGKIAYIRQGDFPLKLTLKDTHSLKEQTTTLTLPNNDIQYTDAGTIIWSIDGQSLFVAANYKVDEKVNTVVIKINSSNPAIQSIIYQDDKALKLILNALHDHYAHLCHLNADLESNCSPDLNLETGTFE